MAIGFGREVSYQDCGFHTGQDWFAAEGSAIYAVEPGTVLHVGPLWIEGEGIGRGPLAIVIDHGDYLTSYSHNRTATVEVGQRVERGQVIGEIGSLGFSRGPHLHFERVEGAFTGDWHRPFEDCEVYRDPGDTWGWF